MATPRQNQSALQQAEKYLRPVLQPESVLPDKTTDRIRDLIDAGNRILFAPRQNSLGEALIADAYDIVVDIVPFIGDVLASGSRTAIAKSQGDEEAAFLHGVDLVIGVIPVVGDIGNVAIPANTILYARQTAKCRSSGKSIENCLFPEDSLERKMLEDLNIISS
jgi:hypothetical protein